MAYLYWTPRGNPYVHQVEAEHYPEGIPDWVRESYPPLFVIRSRCGKRFYGKVVDKRAYLACPECEAAA